MRVLILFLASGHLLLIFLLGHAHLVGQEGVVGVVGHFCLHGQGLLMLCGGVIVPIDLELGDAGLIGEYGAAGMRDEGGSISCSPFFLGEGIVEDVVDIVANPNELLIAVADGNDDSSDASIKNRLHMSSSRGMRVKSGAAHSTVNFMVDSSGMGPISNYSKT